MKIQFIEKIKKYIKKRKLRKLPDEILEEKVEQNIEGEETGKLAFMVGAIGDEKTRIEAAKKVVEAPDVETMTKAETINELPHETKEALFRKSVRTKEIIAQKDINTFLKILINNKELQPYDELYYRIDKAFSDSQLANILETLKSERPESYDEEKVLRIVAKQVDVNLRKYGTFLASHAENLLGKVSIKDEKEENDERQFDILNPQDKQKLFEALKEEREEMRDNPKNPLTDKEIQMLSDENLEKQINQVVQFKVKRQEELQEQNRGKVK